MIGTGIGGAVTLLDQDDLLEGPGLRKVSPLTVPMLMPNGPAAWVGLEFKATGERALAGVGVRVRAPRRWPGRCGCCARARPTS